MPMPKTFYRLRFSRFTSPEIGMIQNSHSRLGCLLSRRDPSLTIGGDRRKPALSKFHMKRERRQSISLLRELLTPEEKTRLHTDLNRALEGLKPLERSIVYLYGVEELSMAEIAKALGLTEGATKLRAHRAYQDLRKILEAK